MKIWIDELIPVDMRNANIITIFKNNDRHNVNNYRGMSTCCRWQDHGSESQCGFRRNRGTTDMIFAVRQLMEKAREQHRNLYIAFVDFTKAFDSVNAMLCGSP